MLPRTLGLLIALWGIAAPCARAHDPFLADIVATPGPAELVLRFTFARSVAAHLAGITAGPRMFFPATGFATHRAAFEQRALTLCTMSAGRETLVPLRAEASLSDDNDVVLIIAYPRPASTRIRLDWEWLARLPAAEGYAAHFVLRENPTSPTRALLLTAEEPTTEISLAQTNATTRD